MNTDNKDDHYHYSGSDPYNRMDQKFNHLETNHLILKAKVDGHDDILDELKKATENNTKAIEEVKEALNGVTGAIKDGVRTVKIVGYTAAFFFFVNYYGWEAVIKRLTGMGK